MSMKRNLAARFLPNGLPLAFLHDNGIFVRIRNERFAACREFSEPTSHDEGARPGRFGLYRHLASQIAGPIDYLEFGVWKGQSIKQWAALDTHADSRFYGFDTFEGLPEDWGPGFTRGHFTTDGKTPATLDPRISFVKGLFQDTLYGFLEGHTFDRQLVVNVDCDIYSASLFVLTVMDRVMHPGTKLILDDFYSLEHQFRAFVDYDRSFCREWKALGKTASCVTVAIEMTK